MSELKSTPATNWTDLLFRGPSERDPIPAPTIADAAFWKSMADRVLVVRNEALAAEVAALKAELEERAGTEKDVAAHLTRAGELLDEARELSRSCTETGGVDAREVSSDLDYAIAALLDSGSYAVDRVANAIAILVRMQCKVERSIEDDRDDNPDDE